MSTYTRWYRDGSVSVTKNSNVVTGTSTYWLTAGLNPGDIFKVDGVDYEIVSITDNTHLTIAGNYAGTTGSDKAYAIVRNFTATMPSKIASQTAELLGDFAKYVDTDMQSIHGKSAYQIACDKGYVGTESEWVSSLKGLSAYAVAVENGYEGTAEEWLEALKADNEWATLDSRTAPLTWNNSAIHNVIARGQDLGEFTAEHLAEIKAATFRDMWLGDYFTNTDTGSKYYIAGFNYLTAFHTRKYGITLLGELPTAQPLTDSENPNAFYAESYWYNTYRPEYISQIEEFFGADNIPEFSVYSPIGYERYTADGMTFYKPNAFVSLTSKVHLPTFSMMNGHAVSPYHLFRPYLQYSYSTPNAQYYGQLPIYRAGYGAYSGLFSVLSDCDDGPSHVVASSINSGVFYEAKTNRQRKLAVFHIQ